MDFSLSGSPAVDSLVCMRIREARETDFESIWPMLEALARAGETYAFPSDLSKEAGRHLWMEQPNATLVVEADGEILATYYIKTNQQGPGSHVCNAGYITAPRARGRGLATTMCEHSQKTAVDMGYLAMQFNFVAATNTGAIRLWTKLGFETVGRLDRAFSHPTSGLVDALIMYKWLGPAA